MWISDIRCQPAPSTTGPTEPAIATMVAATLAGRRDVIELVIDGRAPDTRRGSTANYRLQRALELPRAAPVASWSPNPQAAYDTLDRLLALLPQGRCALLVAAASRPATLATALLAPSAWGTDGFRLERPDAPGESGGNGFLRLLTAAAAAPTDAEELSV